MKTKAVSGCRANEVIPRLLRSLGRLGSRLAKIYESGDHRRLLTVHLNPKGYGDWRQFFRDYQAVSLCKKYIGLKTGYDLKQIALSKFRMSEDACAVTNERVIKRDFSFLHRSLIETARMEVSRILGVFSWDGALPYMAHGPGSCVGLRRSMGHPWYKYGAKAPTITGELVALDDCFSKWSCLLDSFRRANGVNRKVCSGSEVITVPKDARGHRTIAREPLLNMFYQKGIGGLIRSRLRRSGCDLNDQSINQELARAGSIDGSWATLDLSAASDSVSKELVRLLLPDDWFEALFLCRSHKASIGGESLYLSKFSSMGNGYTFELESLIFLALARACSAHCRVSGRDVSVYGDDIILRPQVCGLFIELLSVCGFKTNAEKSFIDGPFRESCGKHYFQGRDVTPLYLKRRVRSSEEIYWLLNSIKRLAFRFSGYGYGLDGRLQASWDYLLNCLPRQLQRLSIPEGFGDVGVLRDLDEARPNLLRVKRGWSGYLFRGYVRRYTKVPLNEEPALVWRLHSIFFRCGLPLGDCGGASKTLEMATSKFRMRVVKLSSQQWSCLGPWVSPDAFG